MRMLRMLTRLSGRLPMRMPRLRRARLRVVGITHLRLAAGLVVLDLPGAVVVVVDDLSVSLIIIINGLTVDAVVVVDLLRGSSVA
jgi:cytochrome b561